MKDITLKIVGKQEFDGMEEENVEFITDGRLYKHNGDAVIVYDETEVTGIDGCKTTIRVKENAVKMRRNGLGTELYFEAGKRFNGMYHTPYGPVGIEVLTDYVKNDFDVASGRGLIDIGYQISLEGIAEGRNRITIRIM
jgi:uncharacterized beta-barrel protein YwiB (DUF1934 family)